MLDPDATIAAMRPVAVKLVADLQLALGLPDGGPASGLESAIRVACCYLAVERVRSRAPGRRARGWMSLVSTLDSAA